MQFRRRFPVIFLSILFGSRVQAQGPSSSRLHPTLSSRSYSEPPTDPEPETFLQTHQKPPFPSEFQENPAIPHGTIISHCTTPSTIALTFDDGPSPYTSSLLTLLAAHNTTATFFILGGAGNASPVGSLSLLHSIHVAGHQLASHGYSHTDLTTLSPDSIVKELVQTEDAFRAELGFVPTYFRCPFLACGDVNGVPLRVLGEKGYKVIGVDLDTKDWEVDVVTSEGIFESEVAEGKIVLAHDIKRGTVEGLVGTMLRVVEERGLRAVSVGECLGEGREGWYRP